MRFKQLAQHLNRFFGVGLAVVFCFPSVSFGSIFDLPLLKDLKIIPNMGSYDCEAGMSRDGFKVAQFGGSNGGDLFRYTSLIDQTHSIEKRYSDPKALYFDLKMFRILNDALAGKSLEYQDIHAIEVYGMAEHRDLTTVQESVIGETVESFYRRLTDPAQKEAFRKFYQSRIEFVEKQLTSVVNRSYRSRLMSFLLPNHFVIGISSKESELVLLRTSRTYLHRTVSEDDISLFIHSRNVVIDLDGNLWIIDPN